jgi:hypothetical protein
MELRGAHFVAALLLLIAPGVCRLFGPFAGYLDFDDERSWRTMPAGLRGLSFLSRRTV